MEHTSEPGAIATGLHFLITRKLLKPQNKISKTAEQVRNIQWFCAFLLLFYLMSPVLAQEKPKAVQVDEFGRVWCDELGMRASGLVQRISKTPNSRGLIISYPKTDGRNRATQQFRQILASFEFAGLEDRVDFVLGEERSVAKIELWSVPQGANEPNYKGEKWNSPTPDLSRAFIYGSEDEIGECPTFVTRKFAELLSNNPGSRANIIVREGGRGSLSAHGFADQWVDDLRDKFGISRNRIRVFYGKHTNSLTYAEFWFVPAEKK